MRPYVRARVRCVRCGVRACVPALVRAACVRTARGRAALSCPVVSCAFLLCVVRVSRVSVVSDPALKLAWLGCSVQEPAAQGPAEWGEDAETQDYATQHR